MFDPYQPGAFERARREIAELPEPANDSGRQVRAAILHLLDRLESDPVFCARWVQRQRRERTLFEHFGAQEVRLP